MTSMPKKPKAPTYVSTTNACKLCTPLGATMVFKGVRGGVPYLHGSQGCATYMRRYIISHFREPMDIASSSLGEKHAVYGGGPNLKQGILNIMKKYRPELIGLATTCLTETIGDDVGMLLGEFRKEFGDLPLPEIVHVSTPSYQGTHMEGFHAAVRALAEQLCTEKAPDNGGVNVLPGFVSAEDMRYLKDVLAHFGTAGTMLPDYSETLDGPALEDYQTIPEGGTTIDQIRAMSGAAGTIECGRVLSMAERTAGTHLNEKFGVPLARVGVPVGLRETDAFFDALSEFSGKPLPRRHELARGRLVDAYVDGHKYVFGKRAVIYGEEDLVVGLTAFLAEIGVVPVLVATGGESGKLTEAIGAVTDGVCREMPEVREGADFWEIAEQAEALAPDILVGHSKGYPYAREWKIPLLRVGFPIHDRFGGHRILHLGYDGALRLFDTLVNLILEKKQSDSPIGYWYL